MTYKTYKQETYNYTIEMYELKDGKELKSEFKNLSQESYNELVKKLIDSKLEENKRRL